MSFRAADYGPEVAAILAQDGDGLRPMPLVSAPCPTEVAARLQGSSLPPLLRGGLYIYFADFEHAHTIAQDIPTAEGSYWHAIAHRLEPDAGNAAYWFRQVGKHPIFPALARAAASGAEWDPFAFIELCEQARRQPGSDLEARARAGQLVEWQLLFDYCARESG